jgi:hypothetical protein
LATREWTGSISSCIPSAPAKHVASVERKLREHLDRVGLGLPLNDKMTVKEIYESMMSTQEGLVAGELSDAVESVLSRIAKMANLTRSMRELLPPSQPSSFSPPSPKQSLGSKIPKKPITKANIPQSQEDFLILKSQQAEKDYAIAELKQELVCLKGSLVECDLHDNSSNNTKEINDNDSAVQSTSRKGKEILFDFQPKSIQI